MPDGPHFPLHPIPHDLVGRAIKDSAFRHAVLTHKDTMEELNGYLVGEGYAPISEAAFSVIRDLDGGDVDEALESITANSANLAS